MIKINNDRFDKIQPFIGTAFRKFSLRCVAKLALLARVVLHYTNVMLPCVLVSADTGKLAYIYMYMASPGGYSAGGRALTANLKVRGPRFNPGWLPVFHCSLKIFPNLSSRIT